MSRACNDRIHVQRKHQSCQCDPCLTRRQWLKCKTITPVPIPTFNNWKSNQQFVDAATFRLLTFSLHYSLLLSGISTGLTANFFDALLQCKFNFSNRSISVHRSIQFRYFNAHTLLMQCSYSALTVYEEIHFKIGKGLAYTALTNM